MNIIIKNAVFSANQMKGGNHGPFQPPKNSVTISADTVTIPIYSPTKNRPNFMPEYSM